jgi:hypothetical protein
MGTTTTTWCAGCIKWRKIHGRGLCTACYNQAIQHGELEEWPTRIEKIRNAPWLCDCLNPHPSIDGCVEECGRCRRRLRFAPEEIARFA